MEISVGRFYGRRRHSVSWYEACMWWPLPTTNPPLPFTLYDFLSDICLTMYLIAETLLLFTGRLMAALAPPAPPREGGIPGHRHIPSGATPNLLLPW